MVFIAPKNLAGRILLFVHGADSAQGDTLRVVSSVSSTSFTSSTSSLCFCGV